MRKKADKPSMMEKKAEPWQKKWYKVALQWSWKIRNFFRWTTGQFSKVESALSSFRRKVAVSLEDYQHRIRSMVSADNEFNHEPDLVPWLVPCGTRRMEKERTAFAVAGENLASLVGEIKAYEELDDLFFEKSVPTSFLGKPTRAPTEIFEVLYLGGHHASLKKLLKKIEDFITSSATNKEQWQRRWMNYHHPNSHWYYHPLMLLLIPVGMPIELRQEIALAVLNWCVLVDNHSEATNLLLCCAASLGVGRDASGQVCLYPTKLCIGSDQLKEAPWYGRFSPLGIAMGYLWRNGPGDRKVETEILQYLQGQGYTLFSPNEHIFKRPWKIFLNVQTTDAALVTKGFDLAAIETLLKEVFGPFLTGEQANEHKAVFEDALQDEEKNVTRREEFRQSVSTSDGYYKNFFAPQQSTLDSEQAVRNYRAVYERAIKPY